MSEVLEIQGGTPLHGTVIVSGAKNAALPMLIASLLSSEPCTFRNVPALDDVRLTLQLLEHFGGHTTFARNTATVHVPALRATEASYSLVKALRASFWVLAPLLARGRAARVALPGGDAIGARPVDIHLQALQQMGAEIAVKHGIVYAQAPNGLRPTDLEFRFPSVGATHQIIMAASLTPGLTTIKGAAREPEIIALAELVNKMGGKVLGAGTSTIEIHGCSELGGTEVRLIGDRIEAGTYLMAAAATGGSIRVEGIDPLFLGAFLPLLSELGLDVSTEVDAILIKSKGRLKPVTVKTGPFPKFATDLQALLMAALTLADGVSVIEEHMFEGRFGHISELCRMGANITVSEHTATITGVQKLTGAPVDGLDIRAAACLVIAGLAAEGTTTLNEVFHLKRGYEGLINKFSKLGGSIRSRVLDADDFMFTGC